jgi:hypothetical protein
MLLFRETCASHCYSGLVKGWNWEAFALAASWLASGKSNGDYFQEGTLLTTAVSTPSRVASTTPGINTTIGLTGTWPSLPWRTNFLIRYSGLVTIRIPGQYTFFLTASVGGNAASCSINGVRFLITTLTFGTGDVVGALFSGSMVRLLFVRALVKHGNQASLCSIIVSDSSCRLGESRLRVLRRCCVLLHPHLPFGVPTQQCQRGIRVFFGKLPTSSSQ